MQILVFWLENKHLLIKRDGNIQNVLSCCGRECLGPSLDNTRPASTSDLHSFTSPEVSSSLRFPGNFTVRVPRAWVQVFFHKLSATFVAREKKTGFGFFWSRLCSLKTTLPRTRCACTCLRLSVPPRCTGRPSHVVWRCSCLAAVQKLSSEKTLSVSRTVGHSASHFMPLLLLYCCNLDVWFVGCLFFCK